MVDKNDFDEQLELEAIRAMRETDDHSAIQWTIAGVVLIVATLCAAAML